VLQTGEVVVILMPRCCSPSRYSRPPRAAIRRLTPPIRRSLFAYVRCLTCPDDRNRWCRPPTGTRSAVPPSRSCLVAVIVRRQPAGNSSPPNRDPGKTCGLGAFEQPLGPPGSNFVLGSIRVLCVQQHTGIDQNHGWSLPSPYSSKDATVTVVRVLTMSASSHHSHHGIADRSSCKC